MTVTLAIAAFVIFSGLVYMADRIDKQSKKMTLDLTKLLAEIKLARQSVIGVQNAIDQFSLELKQLTKTPKSVK